MRCCSFEDKNLYTITSLSLSPCRLTPAARQQPLHISRLFAAASVAVAGPSRDASYGGLRHEELHPAYAAAIEDREYNVLLSLSASVYKYLFSQDDDACMYLSLSLSPSVCLWFSLLSPLILRLWWLQREEICVY